MEEDEDKDNVEDEEDQDEESKTEKKKKKEKNREKKKHKKSTEDDSAKPEKTEKKEAPSTSQPKNEDDDGFLLDEKGYRKVTVRSFNNKPYVDIREYYLDKVTSEMKPGKKGIMLPKDQWKKLITQADSISTALSAL